jgi:O-antigen/teichoic acid export membrane protein
MGSTEVGIHGYKWNVIGKWGGQFANFLIFMALARLLSPHDFGRIAIASIYIVFIELLISQGLGMAIIQRKDLEDEHLDTAFWMTIACSVFFASGTLVASKYIASFLGDAELQPFVAALSVGFLFLALNTVPSAILQREMKFFEMTVRQLLALVAGGLTGVGMAFAGLGAWSLVGQALVSYVITFIMNWLVCKWKPKIRFSWKHMKDLWSFSWAVLTGNMIGAFAGQMDQYLIGRTIGQESLGFYSIGGKVTNLITNGITAPATAVALPMLSRVQDEKEKMVDVVYHGLGIAAFVCFPLYFGLICLAPDVIVLLFGQKWAQAGSLLRIFSVGEVVNIVVLLNYPIFMSTGKPHFTIYLLFARALGTVAASLIGLAWGMRGIAIGMVISSTVNAAISIFLLMKIIPISPVRMLLSVKRPFLCSAIMAIGVVAAGMVLPAAMPLWARVAACVALGAGAYIAAAWLLARPLLRTTLKYLAVMAGRKASRA